MSGIDNTKAQKENCENALGNSALVTNENIDTAEKEVVEISTAENQNNIEEHDIVQEHNIANEEIGTSAKEDLAEVEEAVEGTEGLEKIDEIKDEKELAEEVQDAENIDTESKNIEATGVAVEGAEIKVKKEKKVKIVKEIKPNTEESFSLLSYSLAFFLVVLVSLFFSLPSFVGYYNGTSFLYLNEMQFLKALAFMAEGSEFSENMRHVLVFSDLSFLARIPFVSYFAPMLEAGQYLLMYPFAFIFVALIEQLPSLPMTSLLLVAGALAQLLFALSIFFLASSMRYSSRVALGAVCIALVSLYMYSLYSYENLLFIDLLFAAFINFSYLFFHRAWVRKSYTFSTLLLILAFFFVALAFFTKGFTALLLPFAVTVVFLLLHGHFRRINDRDGIVGFVLFLVTIGIWIAVLYQSGQTKYLIELFGLTGFSFANFEFSQIMNHDWQTLFRLDKAAVYLSTFCMVFLFFLPIPIFSEWRVYFKNFYKKFKQARYSNFLLLEAQKEGNAPDVEQDENSPSYKEKYNDYMQASGALFLYTSLFVGLLIFIFTGTKDISSMLILMPAMSIVLSRSLMKFKPRPSKAYGIYLIVLLLSLSFCLLPAMGLDYIKEYLPQVVEALPEFILTWYAIVPSLSYMGLGIVGLCICLVVMTKYYPQRNLYVFSLASCLIAMLAYFTVIPTISVYMADNELPMNKVVQEEKNTVEEYKDLLDTPTPYTPYIDENFNELIF